MRNVIFASILFASPLCALDSESVDGDTLRYTRHVLLQDEVRNHFKLRIGAYEPLDQAILLEAKLNGKTRKVVILRKDDQLACVVMKTGDDDKLADHWLFIDAEGDTSAHAGAGGIIIAGEVSDKDRPGLKQRTRYLGLGGDGLTVMLTYVSEEEVTYEDGRYVVRTTREMKTDNGLKLVETTEYLLDDEPIEEGASGITYELAENEGALHLEESTVTRFSVSTHCKVARRLEREGLNKPALYHARQARVLARLIRLEASDPRHLDAISLVAKLEARLRD